MTVVMPVPFPLPRLQDWKKEGRTGPIYTTYTYHYYSCRCYQLPACPTPVTLPAPFGPDVKTDLPLLPAPACGSPVTSNIHVFLLLLYLG